MPPPLFDKSKAGPKARLAQRPTLWETWNYTNNVVH